MSILSDSNEGVKLSEVVPAEHRLQECSQRAYDSVEHPHRGDLGREGFVLDNLIAAKKAKPMVVVMPAGHTGPFRFGPRRSGSRSPVDEFAQDVLGDVMPLVEKNYRVYTEQKHLAIAGLPSNETAQLTAPHPEGMLSDRERGLKWLSLKR